MAKRRSKDLRDQIVSGVRAQHAEGNIDGYIILYVDESGDFAVDTELAAGEAAYQLRAAADLLTRLSNKAVELADAEEDDQQS